MSRIKIGTFAVLAAGVITVLLSIIYGALTQIIIPYSAEHSSAIFDGVKIILFALLALYLIGYLFTDFWTDFKNISGGNEK